MSSPQNVRSAETNARLSDALASEHCRHIIRILRGRKDAITERELADGVAAAGGSPSDGPDPEALRIHLHHLHLPKLADAGLVEWDTAAQEVAPTDHSVYDVQSLDALGSDADPESVAPVLADDRRRTIVTLVRAENGAVTREALAHELASLEAAGAPAASRVEDVTLQLHHRHLPKLADAGLLEYDRADGTITYEGPPELTPASSRTPSDA